MTQGRRRARRGRTSNGVALVLALVFSLGALAGIALLPGNSGRTPEPARGTAAEPAPAAGTPDATERKAPAGATEETVEPVLLGEGGEGVVPRGEAEEAGAGHASGPSGEDLTLTVPRLGIKDAPLPTGSTQERLDREGLMRLAGTGLPWEAGTNTFIVGHTLGYKGTRMPYVFYELDEMRPGDRVILKTGSGERYVFRVYDEVTVRPEDYWVTYPTDDRRTVVSLQSCVPVPELDRRLVVQAELVS